MSKSTTTVVKDKAVDAGELATALAQDKKFRKKLGSAIGHSAAAQRRVRRRPGLVVAAKFAADAQLRKELQETARDLQDAWRRVEKKKRSHRLRNALLVLSGTGAAAVAVVPQTRNWLMKRIAPVSGIAGATPRVIDADVEVEVPVATAYNQWTQFEEFPQFMEGVEEVRQLDDTRLHWVANIGGRRAEWDAKILEQHPDRQISWVSEDGKKTRGTVSFESLGSDRTLVRLSMSYQAEGPTETLGSAAGLDERRVRADLKRFKQLIESRGSETGAWRGEVSEGETK